jgi:hydrogenase-4 component B
MSLDTLSMLILVGTAGTLLGGLVALVAGRKAVANTVVQVLFSASSAVGLIGSVGAFIACVTGSVPSASFALTIAPSLMTIDAWSAAFLVLIHLGTLLASLFAIGYLPKYATTYAFPTLNFASALFIIGMQATVLSSSVFTFLFAWEVMSISAYFLVIADREEESLKAGFIYFVMAHLGAAALLAGFLILAKGDASATFAMLHANAASLPMSSLALAFFLLFAGFGSKAGLVPLHQWLPYADPQAPSQCSALMSGVEVKIAVYGFLRLALGVFPFIPMSWAITIVVVGLVSALFGVLSAAAEVDLMRLLAWSSIENLGLIFTMIGLGFVFRSLGLSDVPFFVAAIFHMFNHTIFKSGMFMSAGSIFSETGTRNLDDMGGLANKWPLFSVGFLGLVFGAAALPPFGTFYGEWIMLQQLATNILVTSRVGGFLFALIMSVIALVGGLAIFTFGKAFSAIFLARPRTDRVEQVNSLSPMLVWPILIAAALSFVIGIFAAPIAAFLAKIVSASSAVPSMTQPLEVGTGMIRPISIFLLAVILGVLVMIFRRFATSQRSVRVTDTWDCGQPLTARMEYTATGFSSPIRFFFRSVLLSKNHMVTERVTPENAYVLRRRLEWSVSSIWEEWLYRPIANAVMAISAWVKKLQNGVIQFYILLVLVTLLLVLVFAV